MKIDLYDKRILLELDTDARVSLAALAKKLRRSKQFVDYRIKRLEENKVIVGYNTVIDHSRLGYTSIRVSLKFRKVTPEKQAEIETGLAQDPEVWWAGTFEGAWDIGYAVVVKNVLEFYEYWDRVQERYREFIYRSAVHIYSHIRQYPKSYILGRKNTHPGTEVGGSMETVETDETDMRILKMMADNAKISLLEMGQKLKLSPQTIKARMMRLEKEKVIQGYRALIDVTHFGYRYYKAYINFTRTDSLKAVDYYCYEHPNMLNVNRTIGGWDYEIELQAKSFDEFEEIINGIRREFPGMVNNYEFVLIRGELKMIYFPFK